MKNILFILLFTIPFVGSGQGVESSPNNIIGKWKYNYIVDEIKVFTVYKYEFKKNNTFTLQLLDHSNYSRSITSEIDGDIYKEYHGEWETTDTDIGIKISLTFNSDNPSNEFGYGIYTIPDTTKILPSTGDSYNYFHFNSGIITLITDETFLLDLDKSGTPYKETPLIFNKIKL
jgi:hypothetical protein